MFANINRLWMINRIDPVFNNMNYIGGERDLILPYISFNPT